MPHKHTRKGEQGKSTIDLPPSTIARPLSVSKAAKSNGIFTSEISAPRKGNKRKRNAEKTDDTPKAFARLMAFAQGKKLPKGLDDGVRPTRKQKKAEAAKIADGDAHVAPVAIVSEVPTIRPGERMSEFSARVDAALPISGLINNSAKNGKDPLGLKVARTKTEKKMHRMYKEWREQDVKIQEKKEEAADLAEAEAEEDDTGPGLKWKIDNAVTEARGKKKGKGKKKKVLGEIDDGEDDDDPWAAVARARNEGPRRLNDVVQAPPQFSKAPREKFNVRGAGVDIDNVPKAAGSLKRREALGEERRTIVENYRQMMKDNKVVKDKEEV